MSLDTRRTLDFIRNGFLWAVSGMVAGVGIEHAPPDIAIGVLIGAGLAVVSLYVGIAVR